MRIAQKRAWLAFALLCASSLYSGLPSFAADRQLVIAPVKAAPEGEKRLALIIGNSSYKTSPLKNPVNDARSIGKALANTGFKVTVLEDASQAVMRRAMRTFGDELQAGGVGLFYYAGHGMQVKGKNFLIPVNAEIEREDEIEDQAVDANVILAKMDAAKNSLNLMILDACRNNPFSRSYRSSAQGLAQMDAPSGTLIAFATSPGSVAADGDGENGLYTKHLLANLNRPGLPVEQLFKEVRIGVTRDTKDKQVPWESSSLKGNFFFVPGEATLSAEAQRREIEKTIADRVAVERATQQKEMEKMIQQMLAQQRAALEEDLKKRGQTVPEAPKPAPAPVVAAPAPTPTPAPVDRNRMELAFWDSIKASSDPADFRGYLDQYPQGTFAVLARNRLNSLKPAPVVATAPVPAPTPVAAAAPAPVATPPAIAALKPIEPPKPAPAAAPIQLASAAPTSLLGFGIDDPRYPKIGDLFEYRIVDIYTKAVQNTRFEVTAVSKEGILETGAVVGNRPASRAHAAGAYLRYVGDFLQLSPYFIAFGLKEGDSWRDLVVEGDKACVSAVCRYDGKVVGREKVSVPAGTFDALKVVIDFNWTARSGGGVRAWKQYTYWYSDQAKRVVKTEARFRVGTHFPPMGPDYDIELTSYIPASQRTPSTAGVQVASAAPTAIVASGVADPHYPKVGDYWQYRYVDSTTRIEKKARIDVVAVDKDTISDTTDDEAQRSYTNVPKVAHNRLWLELTPYLASFDQLKVGQSWNGLRWDNYATCNMTSAGCRFEAKVVGNEDVTTPAGTFKAVKVVIDFNGRTSTSATSTPPAWRVLTYWYAAEAKRVVKARAVTRAGVTNEPDFDVELISYKLN